MKYNGIDTDKIMRNGERVRGHLNGKDLETGIITDGLVLWLDGEDFSNMPPTATWKDRSGKGNNAITSGFAYNSESGSKQISKAKNKNLCNDKYWVLGKVIASAGGSISNNVDSMYSSVYIPINPNALYTLSVNDTGIYSRVMDWYDENFNYIQADAGGENIVTKTSPSNSKYVRVNFYNSPSGYETIIDVQLEEGGVATVYEPFVGTVEKSVVFDGVDDYISVYFENVKYIQIVFEKEFQNKYDFLYDVSTDTRTNVFASGNTNIDETNSYINNVINNSIIMNTVADNTKTIFDISHTVAVTGVGMIGSKYSETIYTLKGKIYSVLFYSRDLTEIERTQNYNVLMRGII